MDLHISPEHWIATDLSGIMVGGAMFLFMVLSGAYYKCRYWCCSYDDQEEEEDEDVPAWSAVTCCRRIRNFFDFIRMVVIPTLLCICNQGSDFMYILTVPMFDVKLQYFLFFTIWLPTLIFFYQSLTHAFEKTSTCGSFLCHFICRFFAYVTCNINLFLDNEIA